MAAKRNNHVQLYLLLKARGDQDSKDVTGRSPLLWALEFNNEHCVRLLLAAGSDPFVTQAFHIN